MSLGFDLPISIKRPVPLLVLIFIMAGVSFGIAVSGEKVAIQAGYISNPATDKCKNGAFKGYVSNRSKIECSNGEVKDGCVLTSSGFMCGDVTYTAFPKR